MVYTSELGGRLFGQWFDCFTILFGVSSTDLMEEYKNLREMVRIEMEEESFYRMSDYSFNSYVWVKDLSATNNRKEHYNNNYNLEGNNQIKIGFIWNSSI